MKHLFVPYELAIKLKEKGFDEICLSVYVPLTDGSAEFELGISDANKKSRKLVSAPIYQQAIDWFRDKHKIVIEARPLNTLDWWDAYVWNKDLDRILREPSFKTNYEALNHAIQESLKLI